MFFSELYVHGKNITHRDIKSENILFKKENTLEVKLIDFGMSYKNEGNEKKLSEILGTPFYMAPEIFNGKYDNKVDLWACGVLLYELLSGG